MEKLIRSRMAQLGVADVGFARAEDGAPGGLGWSISLVARLSDAVVDEIDTAPTHAYFHHYRTVNAFLDQAALAAGLLLQQNGWRYFPVAASQSINGPGRYYEGLYSHKKAACLAGLGTIGQSNLFLHRLWGPRVRLATLFTDCPLPAAGASAPAQLCTGCGACVRACPAHALTGCPGLPDDAPRRLRLDPAACSKYMKDAFGTIGRGAVCGICMRVCPAGRSQTAAPQPAPNDKKGEPL